MTTYNIHPGDRLQRRIARILTEDLLNLEAFTGCVVVDDRVETEQAMPCLVVRISESTNQPTGSALWQVTVTVHLMEDRAEANKTLAGDDRPRHEIRAENLSARLFAVWDEESLADRVNAISNGQGVHVLKAHSPNVANTGEVDYLGTEYSFTMLAVSTEQ
jgi:hypothetical protein